MVRSDCSRIMFPGPTEDKISTDISLAIRVPFCALRRLDEWVNDVSLLQRCHSRRLRSLTDCWTRRSASERSMSMCVYIFTGGCSQYPWREPMGRWCDIQPSISCVAEMSHKMLHSTFSRSSLYPCLFSWLPSNPHFQLCCNSCEVTSKRSRNVAIHFLTGETVWHTPLYDTTQNGN